MKDILKYSIWAGLYLVLTVPFIVGNGELFPSMFFPFITGKAFTFRIIVEIIFGLWLILILKDREFRPKFSWIFGSLSIFVFVMFLADIFAVAPFKAFWSNFERMEGWVTMIHLWAYFLVLSSMFNTKDRWLWFLRANILAGFIMAIWSLVEGSKEDIVRVSGPLGNPIYISIYFLFIFFFSLILWYKEVLVNNLNNWPHFKKVFSNILFYTYLISATLSFYIVYRTSRGVLLGAVVGLLVTAILIAILEKNKKVIRHISIGVIVLVIAVIVAFISLKDSALVKNNPTLLRLAEISWDNVSGQARQYVWPMAIKGFKERPILGWGQDGFNYVFNKYYDPRMYGQEQWFDRAHNAPLDALVAGGIFGLLSYLFIFGSAIHILWFRKNNLDIPARAIFTGIFAGYFFQALFVFDTLMSYVMFVTALAYIHSRLVEGQERKLSLPSFLKNEEHQNYIFIPIIIILIGVGVWWINVPAISANLKLVQALGLGSVGRTTDSLNTFKQALSYKSLGDSEIREQLLSYTPSFIQKSTEGAEIKNELTNFTFAEAQKQIKRVPLDLRYYVLTVAYLSSTGNYDLALPLAQKAVELSPRKQTVRFQLAETLFRLNKTEEALAEAKIAVDLEPNYDQAKAFYEQIKTLSKKK